MLGIAAAAQYMSAPGQSYSVAAIKDPMRASLGLSETDFSLAYGFATVLSACLLPFVGRLVDRFGARVMLPLIATGLGSACLCMSRIDSLAELYVGFIFVRSLGQGALSLVSVWLVSEWFERRRGIATAIAGLGGGLSVMTIPLINNWIIMRFGWETAWTALAFGVWGVLILPGIFLVRNRPEDIGLHPDGIDADAQPSTESCEKSPAETGPLIISREDSWSVGEVLRNLTFWKLLSVPVSAGLVGTGLVFHQVALLGTQGLTATFALAMMSVQAGFAMLMAFPMGWLTDRFDSRYILFVSMLVLATANLLVMTMTVTWLAIVYSLLLGLHGSVMRSTATVVWVNYYGRAQQGAVRGVAFSAMILASALGPLPLALSIDYYDSYTPALALFLILPLISAVAVWTAHPPRKVSD
jgi:MFS family permease